MVTEFKIMFGVFIVGICLLALGGYEIPGGIFTFVGVLGMGIAAQSNWK